MDSRQSFSQRITSLADAIEAELRRIGLWETQAPPADKLRFTKPYAADTLNFTQWLQFIFLPRVRDLIGSDKDFPRGSAIGDYAPEALPSQARDGKLLKLLRDFDAALAPDDDFYSQTAGQRWLTPGTLATLWTATLLILGTVFALGIQQFAPRVREQIVSFSATEPSPSAFDLLAFALVREGPAAQPTRQDLRIKLYRNNKTDPGAGLAIEPKTLASSYQDAGGQTVAGTLTPDVVVAWMKRNGVEPADEASRQRLTTEAAEVVQLARAAGTQSPDVLLRPQARAGANLELSIAHTATSEKAARISPWLRWGLPFGVWALGLTAIWVIARSRTGGAAAA